MSVSSTDPPCESSSSHERFAHRLPSPEKSLILASASTRSLAESAVAAGLLPICCDFFGDRDLLSLLNRVGGTWCGPLSQISDLPQLLQHLPPELPVCWAGGFEHAPECLALLAKTRPVLGATPDAVAMVRCPENLQRWMRSLPVRFPDISRTPPPHKTSWLSKRQNSAGGMGVQRYHAEDAPAHAAAAPETAVYYQRWLDGIPCSAMACTAGHELHLLGVSLQLCGWECLGAAEFRFCGNVGPIELPPALETAMHAAAITIARESALRGVFGIDFLLTAEGLWLLEVNPRIPASHWIYDRDNAGLSLSAHLDAVQGHDEPLRNRLRQFTRCSRPAGQFILWTEPSSPVSLLDDERWHLPAEARLADLPEFTSFPPIGCPLLSVLIESNTVEELVTGVRQIREPQAGNLASRWNSTADKLQQLFAHWNVLAHLFQEAADSTATT